MSDLGEPRNNLSWRVTVIERELERLKELKLDVNAATFAERIGTLSTRVGDLKSELASDMNSLRSEMRERDFSREKQIRGFQRIFVGVFTGVGVAITGAVIAIILTGGHPS